MAEDNLAKYRLTQACYLRMKGDTYGNAQYFEEGAFVGPGAGFDFEGPPSLGMSPLNEAAQAAFDDMRRENEGGPPRVKDTPTPAEGGAAPFDPANSAKNSDAEKQADKAAAKK